MVKKDGDDWVVIVNGLEFGRYKSPRDAVEADPVKKKINKVEQGLKRINFPVEVVKDGEQ